MDVIRHENDGVDFDLETPVAKRKIVHDDFPNGFQRDRKRFAVVRPCGDVDGEFGLNYAWLISHRRNSMQRHAQPPSRSETKFQGLPARGADEFMQRRVS